MNSRHNLNRRSFLATVTGGFTMGSGLAFAGAASARNAASTPGPGAGRQAETVSPQRETVAVYDSDKGLHSDNTNIGGARGVGRSRVRQCSDTDSGTGADPLGESRTSHSWSDNDAGPRSDPRRKCPRPWYNR